VKAKDKRHQNSAFGDDFKAPSSRMRVYVAWRLAEKSQTKTAGLPVWNAAIESEVPGRFGRCERA